MTILKIALLAYGTIAAIEIIIAIIGAGIPMLREKIMEKRRQENE